jgi:hypothetical protein
VGHMEPPDSWDATSVRGCRGVVIGGDP